MKGLIPAGTFGILATRKNGIENGVVMKKSLSCVILLGLACAFIPSAAAAPAAAGPEAQAFWGEAFFARLGLGMPIPAGAAAQALTVGVSASTQGGYQFPLGPGRLKAGLDLGCLVEFTQDLPGIDQYVSFFLPLGVFAGYDFPIAQGFYAYGEAQAGYAPTLAFYQLESLPDLGVFKPSIGCGLGAGYELGMFTVQAGARFLAVFYDVNAYMAIVPELRGEIRFGGKK